MSVTPKGLRENTGVEILPSNVLCLAVGCWFLSFCRNMWFRASILIPQHSQKFTKIHRSTHSIDPS